MNKKQLGYISKILYSALPGQNAREIIKTITLWEHSSGPEWTCKRLKAIRLASVQLRSRNPKMARRILEEEGISHKNGIPKGAFKFVVSNFINAQDPPKIRRFQLVLRLYTSYKLQHLSYNQLKKSIESITTPQKGVDITKLGISGRIMAGCNPAIFIKLPWYDPNHNNNAVTGFGREFERTLVNIIYKRFSRFQNLELESHNLSRLKGSTSYTRLFNLPGEGDLQSKTWSKLAASLSSMVAIPESLKAINPVEQFRQELESAGADSEVIGRVLFLQEGGCKARVVASPNAWTQFLFEPLHGYLSKISTALPYSVAHDQNSGGWELKEKLKKRRVACEDMSSATDRFPVWVQTRILRLIAQNVPNSMLTQEILLRYANAIEEASNMAWLVDEDRYKGHIHYACGQPMGLYGSFPLFNLSHSLIIETIAECFGYRKWFSVVGDDVIFYNLRLNRAYIDFMNLWGVELNPQKRVNSRYLGEFAGFLAVKTNKKQVSIWRPYKFTQGLLTNPLSLLNDLGSHIKKWGRYWDKHQELYSRTRSWRDLDLTPLIKQSDKPGDFGPTINSMLLGSLFNRISMDYSLPPYLSEAMSKTDWRLTRDLFFASSEVKDPNSGIADYRNNPSLERLVPLKQRELESERMGRLKLKDDPLIREQKLKDSNNK